MRTRFTAQLGAFLVTPSRERAHTQCSPAAALKWNGRGAIPHSAPKILLKKRPTLWKNPGFFMGGGGGAGAADGAALAVGTAAAGRGGAGKLGSLAGAV